MKDKPTVIVCVYGEGGHQAEMERVITYLNEKQQHINIVTLGPKPLSIPHLAHFQVFDLRPKKKPQLNIFSALTSLSHMIRIRSKFTIQGIISTGPGVAILPIALAKIIQIKSIHIETFCRFENRSLSGAMLYRLVDKFWIQNKSLQKVYPNSEYCGRL